MEIRQQDPTVLVTDDGPVRIITIDRPHARNAVDGPTAIQLAWIVQ